MARPKREAQLNDIKAPLNVSTIVDLSQVRSARDAAPDSGTTSKLAAIFGALADPTRLRIIAILEGRNLCVGDIAGALGLSNSAASHQLRVLRELGLARATKQGRLVYYGLDDDHVATLYRQALDHVQHLEDDR